ncbi:hypothetical protein LINPERHAP1_LOCUS31128, partial [Linum perenne]
LTQPPSPSLSLLYSLNFLEPNPSSSHLYNTNLRTQPLLFSLPLSIFWYRETPPHLRRWGRRPFGSPQGQRQRRLARGSAAAATTRRRRLDMHEIGPKEKKNDGGANVTAAVKHQCNGGAAAMARWHRGATAAATTRRHGGEKVKGTINGEMEFKED